MDLDRIDILELLRVEPLGHGPGQRAGGKRAANSPAP